MTGNGQVLYLVDIARGALMDGEGFQNLLYLAALKHNIYVFD